MNPFRGIFKLSLWDFFAKTLYFLAFIYLARILGVENYGILEFAISILSYFILLADGGLELWATRESTKTKNVQELVARVLPIRLIFAVASFGFLMGLLPVFPNYPFLTSLLFYFGLSLFVSALNLKWVFMGQERMSKVGVGLALTQLVFAVGVFGFIQHPHQLYFIPFLKIIGDLIMAAYFISQFLIHYGSLNLRYRIRGSQQIIRPSLVMGISQGLGLLNYNFDTLLLGFMVGPIAVGLYNAAYRPVTVVLALPLTYFVGLFPALSRSYWYDTEEFTRLVKRSLGFSAIVAFPLGFGGMVVSESLILMLFGENFKSSIPVLQVLIWSAVFVILRGTYRQAFNAANQQQLDLWCASVSAGVNVSLNIVLIPFFGIMGAAGATLLGDIVWVCMASVYFNRKVSYVAPLYFVAKPLVASIIMFMALIFLAKFSIFVQIVCGGCIYFVGLWLLGEPEIRALISGGRPAFMIGNR